MIGSSLAYHAVNLLLCNLFVFTLHESILMDSYNYYNDILIECISNDFNWMNLNYIY